MNTRSILLVVAKNEQDRATNRIDEVEKNHAIHALNTEQRKNSSIRNDNKHKQHFEQ